MTQHGFESSIYPLRLCEVLEQEFAALHQRQSWGADWLLHEGDIVDASALLKRLIDSVHDQPGSPVDSIRAQLSDTLPTLVCATSFTQPDRSLQPALNELLLRNRTLYPPDLLQPDSEAYRLSRLLRARGRAVTTASEGQDTKGSPQDEHVQLNRLLLEAALPCELIRRVDAGRLARLFEKIHELPQQRLMRTALCLSGGGVRSAAFGLGCVQALAEHRALDKFDYLSTVSGGGYLGSWLSTWVHRDPHGLSGVCDALSGRLSRSSATSRGEIDAEPDPVRFLRSYSHFLNPRAGLLSLDTWTWIGLYLRNLSLNWLLLIPLMMLLLLAPRVFAALLGLTGQWHESVPPWLFALATVAAITVVMCAVLNRPSASDPVGRMRQTPAVNRAGPRKLERVLSTIKQQHWILLLGIAPLLLFSSVLSLLAWKQEPSKTRLPLADLANWIVTVPLADLAAVLPVILVDNVLFWGECIVAVAWVCSLLLLPAKPWRAHIQEILVMLAAGVVTWLLVSRLTLALVGTGGHELHILGSSTLHPLHLYTVLGMPAVVLSILAGMTLFIGLVSKWEWIEDEDREWWARFGAWVLVATLAWIVLSSIAVLGPVLLFEFPRLLPAVGGAAGLVAVLVGKSGLTPGSKKPAGSRARKLFSSLGVNTTNALAALFLAVFLAALSLLTSGLLVSLQRLTGNWSTTAGCDKTQPLVNGWTVLERGQVHAEVICRAPLSAVLIVLLGLATIAGAASLLVNLNKFSLHAAYRIRIARTFLGASRGRNRKPNPFTGFDPMDNVRMHELQPGLLRETDLVDPKAIVTRFHDALENRPPSREIAVITKLICSERHDPDQRLHGRLRTHESKDPVLASLQKELVETLNRVLECERMDLALEGFVDGLESESQSVVCNYVEHGNRIFANRKLLELAFPDVLVRFEFPPPPPHKLMHVINLTLNLVHGRNLAWQERKAAPFSVTPMHSGNYYLGYRHSRDYGSGISIATAAAISGAAVSPNMGYSSSPLTTLLLTMFNVRLGWWLGNPGNAGAGTYRRTEPKLSVYPLVSEALGMTDDRSRYVYLSDGGHFENLGLFEMVLRRCQFVVVLDSGADPDYRFDDLGNAVRKIRLDLGIPLDFEAMSIRRLKSADDAGGRYCAIGHIRYSAVDGDDAPDGVVLYFKPVLCGKEPRDVLHYATDNSEFPQEPTTDQFFGEAQFESYRRLGQVAVNAALEGPECEGSMWAVGAVQQARRYLAEGDGVNAWIERWPQCPAKV